MLDEAVPDTRDPAATGACTAPGTTRGGVNDTVAGVPGPDSPIDTPAPDTAVGSGPGLPCPGSTPHPVTHRPTPSDTRSAGRRAAAVRPRARAPTHTTMTNPSATPTHFLSSRRAR